VADLWGNFLTEQNLLVAFQMAVQYQLASCARMLTESTGGRCDHRDDKRQFCITRLTNATFSTARPLRTLTHPTILLRTVEESKDNITSSPKQQQNQGLGVSAELLDLLLKKAQQRSLVRIKKTGPVRSEGKGI
jgi:hypothetical protein